MESVHWSVRRWVAIIVVLAALVGGGILALGLKKWSNYPVFGAPKLDVTIAREGAPVPLGEFANGFSSVLKPALPAVVNIHTSKIVKPRPGAQMPFFNDPFFKQFFGQNPFGGQAEPQPERETSLGSGVIVTADGTILTNNHVIDGATDIKVDLSDRREFKGKVVGTDPKSDIAVLKIDGSGLPTLPLGDSSRLQVGDIVLAIGDPFGVGETATMGIVSATGRGNLGIEEPGSYEDFIQTDAAINPGNSGGAMIDLHGNLVGINTAIVTGGGGGNEGVGFAIPINMARNVMDQIVAHGKVVRAYIGVGIQPVTPEVAKAFGVNGTEGALINDVLPNTPGARAGLKNGDIVMKVNGDPVNDANDLRLRISQMAPGSTVHLQILRDGKPQDVTVTLAELPEKTAKEGESGENSGSGLEGVQVQDLTPDMRQELSLPPDTHGVVVTSVDPASAAAAAGLGQGDVILEVNHKPVSTIEQYKQALAGAGKSPVLLLVMGQNGGTAYIVVGSQ